MTALNVIMRSDAIYIITDGEVWNGPKGVPVHEALPRPKVIPIPHLKAALAIRGSAAMLPSLYSRITHRRSTFEHAAAYLADDLRDTVDAMIRQHPIVANSDVVLAGWPESRPGPECMLTTNHNNWGGGQYGLVRCTGVLTPNDGSLSARMGNREVHEDPSFDPEAEAVALIKAQRSMPNQFVGAFTQLTIIRPDRIESRAPVWFEDEYELGQVTGVA